MSTEDRLNLYGQDDDGNDLLVRVRKDGGFFFDIYENGVYAGLDISDKSAALLAKWLLDKIEGVDEG